MCGIAGIFAYQELAPPVDRAELLRIREAMLSRGPDGAGLWFSTDERIGLAHRRLAIIDLSPSGAQPMAAPDGSLVVTFNGEIYNYRELRNELEAKDYRFRSTSDTEVLLHLYADRGADMVHALQGMYAFAIWDQRRRGLFLARDPMGIKPLYFAESNGSFRFASQVKALLAGNGFRVSPDAAGHVGFHLWGHIPEPYTMYREIRAVGSGCSLWIDANGPRNQARFFDVARVLQEAESDQIPLDSGEARARLREALADSVHRHLIADVPVGVFLSSGIYSNVLAALKAETGDELHTITLGFRDYQGTRLDEVPSAEQLARNYGANHKTVWVTREEFVNEAGNILQAMDQPSIDGVNSYFVSKAAASAGLKVAMSGIGGDELFQGYSSSWQVPLLVHAIAPMNFVPMLGKWLRKISAPVLCQSESPKYAGLFEFGGNYGGAYLLRRGLFMPWELAALLPPETVSAGLAELEPMLRLNESVTDIARPRSKVAALEMTWYLRNQLLRDADWAGMAHSVEIRVPFVDADLLKSLAPLLVSKRPPRKRDLVQVPAHGMSTALAHSAKKGFSVPVSRWLLPPDRRPATIRNLRAWSERVIENWPVPGPSGDAGSQKTILVFRIGQLGDTLVSLPAIQDIRNRHPRDRLVLLTDRHPGRTGYISSWDILGPTGWFDHVLFYVPKTLNWIYDVDRGSLPLRLRRFAPDIAYVLTPRRTMWQHYRDRIFMKGLVGAREVYDSGIDKEPARRRGADLPQMTPEWLRLRNVVPGEHVGKVDVAMAVSMADKDHVEFLLRLAWGRMPSQLLAIGPGSKMPAKVWPQDRFFDLTRRLLEQYPDLHVVVLGGPEDRAVGAHLANALGNRICNLAGTLSVYGSGAALLSSRVYVGNDTGTMHLAAMVGRPCVALFSARDFPGHWDPYGAAHIILRHDVECAGCMLEVCNEHHNKCMKLISVDEVYGATVQLLDRVDI